MATFKDIIKKTINKLKKVESSIGTADISEIGDGTLSGNICRMYNSLPQLSGFKIVIGTKVYTATTNDAINIFNNSTVEKLLDIDTGTLDINKLYVTVMNGDFGANGTHVQGINYSPDSEIFYAVLGKPTAGSIRINYLIVYNNN